MAGESHGRGPQASFDTAALATRAPLFSHKVGTSPVEAALLPFLLYSAMMKFRRQALIPYTARFCALVSFDAMSLSFTVVNLWKCLCHAVGIVCLQDLP